MQIPNFQHPLRDPRKKSFLCFSLMTLITAVYLLSVIFLHSGSLLAGDYGKISRIGRSIQVNQTCPSVQPVRIIKSNHCNVSCVPPGSEALPKDIVSKTTDLEMRTLMGVRYSEEKVGSPRSLLAMAVGIKQKQSVDQIVKKFLSCNFAIMLFHYDGIVDEWNEFNWSGSAIHVSASKQTKWWFAKRFLHPDVVSDYRYVFLWDEDIDVTHFHPERYVTIVQQEGLEISQPALDASKSEVHHQITIRMKNTITHRRIFKFYGKGTCGANSTGPPCSGWVEMMVPVFSRASWRCVWYMIQNDLIHGWGLDFKFGYCAQGDRTKKVGVVDAEYVIHKGIPSLGASQNQLTKEEPKNSTTKQNATDTPRVRHHRPPPNNRLQARYRSYKELFIFKHRWDKAVEEDKSWRNPYNQSVA